MNNINISELESQDYEKLANFLAGFKDDKRSYQQWIDRLKFWWDKNPAYHANHPRGVV